VKRNCAFIGGAANLLVPVDGDGSVSGPYRESLVAYDPDMVVLAPGQTPDGLGEAERLISPFAVLSWEERNSVGGPDPWECGTGENAKVAVMATDLLHSHSRPLVATWDPGHEDDSRLALVACGDLVSRAPMLHVVGNREDWDASGARERYLERCLRPGFAREDLGAKRGEEGVIGPPNLADLTAMIADDCKFPLGDPLARLEASCKTSIYWRPRCLAAVTLHGLIKRWEERPPRASRAPSLAILVSESFGIDEAVLFWNLRGSGRKAVWLSFRELEGELEGITEWLESDLGGQYYAYMSGTAIVGREAARIGFAADASSLGRLEGLVGRLSTRRTHTDPEWRICAYDDCTLWDQPPQVLESRSVPVSRVGRNCTVYYRADREISATSRYVLRISWDKLLLPKSGEGFRRLVSEGHAAGVMGFRPGGGGAGFEYVGGDMPKCRPDARRDLRAQIDGGEDVLLKFTNPSLQAVLDDIFRASRFSGLSPSSAAKYHDQFCRRAGGLEEACRYLSEEPFRGLLELLRDNENKRLPGWIIERPSRRRALNHYHALSVLDVPIPPKTDTYFATISDQLPDPMVELIDKGIIDRGFLLSCSACSYKGWYSLDVLGRRFACTRCDHRQLIRTNPLWLYKLSEVVFQGFANNMQVPLLTLGLFKRGSKRSFSWVSDSNVMWMDGTTNFRGNLDLVFACDGKYYVGEAKSSDTILSDQLEFYARVAVKVPVDGLVFSTSQERWSAATQKRIDQLGRSFRGEVVVITGEQLYPAVR